MRFESFFSKFHSEESGQDMLEYAMVLLAVLAAVVAGTTTLSATIATELTNINAAIAALALP
jgi:Flp pilus assembly pilin Flp